MSPACTTYWRVLPPALDACEPPPPAEAVRNVAAGTGTFILPVASVQTYNENLENYDKPLVSWTTYAAKRGESVDAIARRYGVSPAQLRTVNDKFKLDKKGRLRVAQQVLVPMQAAHKAAAPVQVAQAQILVAADAPGESAVKRVSSSVRWYTVRAGDTLFSIARRANTALDTILHLNNLAPTAILRPGLKLRLQ